MVMLEFDGMALFEAMDAHRVSRGLSWPQVADELWELSAVLNSRRHDHPISPSTLSGMARRGNTSCQHALFILRWLGRTPESFLTGEDGANGGSPLPEVGPDRRLRWDLKALYDAMDKRRREDGLTWPQLAVVLRCTPSQISGLRKVRFAINIKLVMRVVQWTGRPAADFVYAAVW
jgi:hypothetical protein